MPQGRSNTLIGQVGEFLVCAELGRMGLFAAPFSGNVPGFDVIATDDRCRSVPIQVKASKGTTWQLDARTYLDIAYDAKTGRQSIKGTVRLPDPMTIYVFVRLRSKGGVPDRFYVLTRKEFQKVVLDHHAAYLKKHGGRRPRQPGSFHLAVREQELEHYRDNWDLIRRQLELIPDPTKQ